MGMYAKPKDGSNVPSIQTQRHNSHSRKSEFARPLITFPKPKVSGTESVLPKRKVGFSGVSVFVPVVNPLENPLPKLDERMILPTAKFAPRTIFSVSAAEI
jgi:hypothetical protein